MTTNEQRIAIAIGRDCCGKEIIPLLDKKLEVRTNRHTTTDGYLWGWIEGTTANTVWSDDHKFNHAAAVTLVRDYNAESSAKHEANTTKSVSPTSPATEESSVTLTSGNESDFVTKSMTADEIMAGKMAYNLHQIREQLLALGKYQTNLLGGGGWDILVTMISDAERVHSHLCRRWNTPTPNPPNHNEQPEHERPAKKNRISN